jgi:hypothetical protein
MSFLKQLLTPFIEFDADKKPIPPVVNQPAPAPVATPPAAPRIPTIPPVVAIPTPDVPAQHPLVTSESSPTANTIPTPTPSPVSNITGPLPEHVQYFERLIEQANANNPLFQGPDYKEFIDSKLDIDDISDEALKYKTAFNILKSAGLTKDKLFTTGQEYINLIGRDLNAFQSAQAQQYGKEVRPKEQEIQKKAEELQALTLKMQALKSEINQLSQAVNATKDQLNTTKNSFLLAGENKQKEIQTELQKITRYF